VCQTQVDYYLCMCAVDAGEACLGHVVCLGNTGGEPQGMFPLLFPDTISVESFLSLGVVQQRVLVMITIGVIPSIAEID